MSLIIPLCDRCGRDCPLGLCDHCGNGYDIFAKLAKEQQKKREEKKRRRVKKEKGK